MNTPSLGSLLSRLWLHIEARRRVQFALLFMLMILASFAEVVSIGTVLPFLGALTAPETIFSHPIARPVINALDIQKPEQLLLPLTVIFMLGVAVSGLTRFSLLWAQTRLSHEIGADFSMSIYRRTLFQPYSVHVGRNSSEVVASISSKAKAIVNNTVLPILTIISSLLMLLSIFVALVVIEPLVAISAFVGFGSIYVIVILLTKKKLSLDSKRISHESNQVIKALQEGLGGIRDVLIDGTQETYCQIYRSADQPLRHAIANVAIIGGGPRFIIESIGMILIAWLAYSMTRTGDGVASAIPVMGAMALGAQRMLPVLQQSYWSWQSMRGGQMSLSDTLTLLDQPIPVYALERAPAPIPFNQSIQLSSICFSYSSQGSAILSDVTLEIPKGSKVGFIGITGSGKSTLIDLIMGLLQPSSGGIAVDGLVIDQSNYRGWQAHIAHVPQAIFLADTTIAENIAFGVPFENIDMDRVRSAARKAQISNTIESWSQGYQTPVGERGVRLSGGQRQRIGIARALYKKADVIVFDEATSALDNDTELAVMESIDQLGSDLTVLIVAHRLSTLRNCDLVVELTNGKVSRTGTYDAVITQTENLIAQQKEIEIDVE